MSDSDDNLAYDGELGWIDPEDVLGSIGIKVDEGPNFVTYHVPARGTNMPCLLAFSYETDWAVLRWVIEDAEYRAKARERQGQIGTEGYRNESQQS